MPRGVYTRHPWMRANTGEPMHITRPDTVRYLRNMGLTYKQIAEAVGVSASTIKKHIRRPDPDGLVQGVLRSNAKENRRVA